MSHNATARPNPLVRMDHEARQIFQLQHPLKHRQSLLMHVVQVFVARVLIQAEFHLLVLAPILALLADQKIYS
jgi:hypothetical protein